MKKIILTLAMLAWASLSWGQADPFTPGVHYKLIEPAQPTDSKDMVEVVEVFSYGCVHCANFQPYIEPWAEEQSESVSFSRVPVVFQRSWEPLARAYYAAESLGVLDKTHHALFDAIHKERRRIRGNEDIAALFESAGVPSADYTSAAKSFTVETKLRRGVTMASRWGVTGTPSVVINGKYLANGTMAGSYEGLMNIIDYLVTKEKAMMASQTSAAMESAQAVSPEG
ncbi:MAG: thiol:disulfide interchange protein DsbA/DsbL [Xanthomonadales bacterium]|nr:thiol:disulfide interchange protein DsbA/DsbL [Xanthomonadales bacterium]